jgi:predicted kinase
MECSGSDSRLIILCGLPGSGKSTLGKTLEAGVHAFHFAPDEWMAAVSLDIYDEDRRSKVEALWWKLSKELLSLRLTVIIEWGNLEALRAGRPPTRSPGHWRRR